MAVAVTMEFSGATLEQYDQVITKKWASPRRGPSRPAPCPTEWRSRTTEYSSRTRLARVVYYAICVLTQRVSGSGGGLKTQQNSVRVPDRHLVHDLEGLLRAKLAAHICSVKEGSSWS